jgi:hypothetical protein
MGKYFINFSPAVSNRAATKMRRTMRQWRLHLRSDKALDDLARMGNPVLRSWINYYGRFYKSALNPVFRHLIRTPSGRGGNSKGYEVTDDGPNIGSAAWPDENPGCSLIGSFWISSPRLNDGSRNERRRSRTVLRAPGGEIPTGDLPGHHLREPTGHTVLDVLPKRLGSTV